MKTKHIKAMMAISKQTHKITNKIGTELEPNLNDFMSQLIDNEITPLINNGTIKPDINTQEIDIIITVSENDETLNQHNLVHNSITKIFETIISLYNAASNTEYMDSYVENIITNHITSIITDLNHQLHDLLFEITINKKSDVWGRYKLHEISNDIKSTFNIAMNKYSNQINKIMSENIIINNSQNQFKLKILKFFAPLSLITGLATTAFGFITSNTISITLMLGTSISVIALLLKKSEVQLEFALNKNNITNKIDEIITRFNKIINNPRQ